MLLGPETIKVIRLKVLY